MMYFWKAMKRTKKIMGRTEIHRVKTLYENHRETSKISKIILFKTDNDEYYTSISKSEEGWKEVKK